MIYIKTSKVGEYAQAAADQGLHLTIMPTARDGCTRITGINDQRLYLLAERLNAFPDVGDRWPGDTGTGLVSLPGVPHEPAA